MSSSSGAFQTSLNGQVTEKLTRTNYVLWRTQVIPQLRGTGVFGYVDGTQLEPARLLVTTKEGKEVSSPNPLHPIWVREDQQVLGYLLNNLTREVLLTVTTVTTAGALWTMLAGMFSSQSASRINTSRTTSETPQMGTRCFASWPGKPPMYGACKVIPVGTHSPNSICDRELGASHRLQLQYHKAHYLYRCYQWNKIL